MYVRQENNQIKTFHFPEEKKQLEREFPQQCNNVARSSIDELGKFQSLSKWDI